MDKMGMQPTIPLWDDAKLRTEMKRHWYQGDADYVYLLGLEEARRRDRLDVDYQEASNPVNLGRFAFKKEGGG